MQKYMIDACRWSIYTPGMDDIIYQLPSGAYARVVLTLTYGDIIEMVLLSAILFLKIVEMWDKHRS
jgi:hypothetical protein